MTTPGVLSDAWTADRFMDLAAQLDGPVFLAYLAPDEVPYGHGVVLSRTSTADVVRDRLAKWWNLTVPPVLAVAAFGTPPERTILGSFYVHGCANLGDETVLNLCWGSNAEGLKAQAIDSALLFNTLGGSVGRRGRYLFGRSNAILVPA